MKKLLRKQLKNIMVKSNTNYFDYEIIIDIVGQRVPILNNSRIFVSKWIPKGIFPPTYETRKYSSPLNQ